jgi:hypothetical protein
MGPVIEEFIEKYVDDVTAIPIGRKDTGECEVIIEQVRAIIRGGGEAAEHLTRTTLLLYQFLKLSAGNASSPESGRLLDTTLEAAERLGEAIEDQAPKIRTAQGHRAAAAAGTGKTRKRVDR